MNVTVPPLKPKNEFRSILSGTMNALVLVLSVLLIVWISIDTFERVNFIENHAYMTFQFWVCIIFITDFFIGLRYATDKWRHCR